MTREQFLKLKIPVLPYCDIHRSPATKYHEGIHIKSDLTGYQINIWWLNNKISVGFFNLHERNRWKQSGILIEDTKNIPLEKIEKIMIEYLTEKEEE